MKIIFYIGLIAIVALIIYGLYTRISNVDTSQIGETVSNAFSSVTNWIGDKVDELASLIVE